MIRGEFIIDAETKICGWVYLDLLNEDHEDHTIDVVLNCGFKASFFLKGLTMEEYLRRTIYFKQNNL